MNEPTELERRLETRLAEEIKAERVYSEDWSTCQHEFRRLGEIGQSILDECGSCGMVVGLAR